MVNKTETARERSPAAGVVDEVRSTLFSGRIIVGCPFAVLCVPYGIQFTFGVFLPAISADTGWDRASLSVPYSLYVFVYSALGVVTGRLTDRWGPRVVL